MVRSSFLRPCTTTVNFYSSPQFLDAVAAVYFPQHTCSVVDRSVGDRTFRLLDVPGRGPLVRQPFLDMHEALTPDDHGQPDAPISWIPNASQDLVSKVDYAQYEDRPHFLAAPTVIWEGFETWDDYVAYLKTQGSIVKEDLRRGRRMERDLPDVRFLVHDDGDDVVPFCVHWKSKQMLATFGVDLFADARNRSFFEELGRRGTLRASTIRDGDRLLAAWLGTVFDDRWYGWIFTYDPDPELRKLSLGRQLLYRMLQTSHAEGHREFDFSIGDEDYKWYFSTHARAVGPVGTPPLKLRMERHAKAILERSPKVYEGIKDLRDQARKATRAIRR